MTPKEEAIQLVEKFYLLGTEKPLLDVYVAMEYVVAKQCALICVYELIKNINPRQPNYIHWQKVKQEINKL